MSEMDNDAEKTLLTLADAKTMVASAERALLTAARLYRQAAAQAGARSGPLVQQAWTAERMAGGARPRWFSQAGQDRFLDEQVFHGKRDGVFLDIGAYDGHTGSNTLFFEVFRGWSGLLIEPSPKFASDARACRRNPVRQLAVGAVAGEAEFFHVTEGYTQMSGLADSYDAALRAQVEADARFCGETIRVTVETIDRLIEQHGFGTIDFVSLDIEGGEFAALSAFDFGRRDVRAWSIENNAPAPQIGDLMRENGYRCAARIGQDEIYVRM